MFYLNATGNAHYYNVSYDDIFLGNFIPIGNFTFSNDEMNAIWDMIMLNDFFNLDNHYERKNVCDGSFVNITITGNGVIHSAQAENIDMDKIDDIF